MSISFKTIVLFTILYVAEVRPAMAQLYTDAGWVGHGNDSISAYGWSMANAGDVNGDGYDDLLVAAIAQTEPELEEGKLYLYYGSATGLSATPAWTYQSNADVTVLGFSTDAGDINGDGYSDIVAGSIQWDNPEIDEGRVWIWYGSAAGLNSMPDWTYENNQPYALLGSGVAASGDINGDGFDDLFVSAKMWDEGSENEGKVWLFYGSASGPVGPVWSYQPNQDEAIAGFPVNYAGDVNADGYDDVVIGVNGYDSIFIDDGMAVGFYGSASGLSLLPDWAVTQGQKKSLFGHWVDGAGDVNGDGYDDVIVSAILFDSVEVSEGWVFVYTGGPEGIATSPIWFAQSDQEGAQLGYCVAGAGDVNGDGYDDVIAGSKYWTNGNGGEGGAFLWFGSPQGPNQNYCWEGEGNQDSAFFGRHVGGNADFNNDGFSDFFVGAYRYTDSVFQDGKAYVYYGMHRAGDFYYDRDTFCITEMNPSATITGTPGEFFFGDGIVFANNETGEIDLSATGAGTYIVKYNSPQGCITTYTITILPYPDASFTYPLYAVHQNDTISMAPVFLGGAEPGTFTSYPTGLVYDPTNGTIDYALSALGNYTVTNTLIHGLCSDIKLTTVTILPPCPETDSIANEANFHYQKDTFCIDELNPIALIDGLDGGYFYSYDVELMDTISGEVNLAYTGSGGPYQIFHTVFDGCSLYDTATIWIQPDVSAQFIYPFASYLETDPNPLPLLAPEANSGVFYAFPAGMQFVDTLTGEINLSESVPATYTVYNFLTDGICADIDSFLIHIEPLCPQPQNLTVGAITFTSALLSWDTVEWATDYIIYLVAAPDTLVFTVSGENTLLLDGLVADTFYKTWVFADCGSKSSPKSSNQNFTTLDDGIQSGNGSLSYINIFPNPAYSIVHTRLVSERYPVMVTLSDITGKKILSEQPPVSPTHQYQVDFMVNNLASGIYVIEISSGFEVYKTKIFITQ